MTIQTKREAARAILEGLFAHQSRIAIADAVEAGKTQDVSRRTLLRAANELGVQMISNGPFEAFWEKKQHPKGGKIHQL